MGAALAIIVVFLLLSGWIGAAIGGSKGRGVAGFWLGALIGFFGWLIVAVMEPTDEVRRKRLAEAAAVTTGMGTTSVTTLDLSERPCPWCAETIKAAARVCRFCNRDVEPVEVSESDEPSPAAPTEWSSTLANTIQRMLDERGIAAPGAAAALGEWLPGALDGVARLGAGGDEGVIAVSGHSAAIWSAETAAVAPVDLRQFPIVQRGGRLVILQSPSHDQITILAGSDAFAKGWVKRMQTFGATEARR